MTTRFKIIISDTHLGAGLEGAGGNRLEDFTSDVDFVEWVHRLIEESNTTGADVEFIINGDFLEMLQVPAVPRFDPQALFPPAVYAATDEAAAELKLTHVMQGHPGVFAALADFINDTGPRRNVVILKGNHDPELFWPGVQQALRETLGATGDLAGLLEFPVTSYISDGVYVEHGNQYTEKVNRFVNFAAPLDPLDPTRLEAPWGSRFVIEFFNQVERQRGWVDGVKPMTALIWYSLQFDFAFAIAALRALLAAMPHIGLPPDLAPEAQAAAASLENELADPAAVAALEREYQTDPAVQRALHSRILNVLGDLQVDGTPPPAAIDLTPTNALQIAEEIQERTWLELRNTAERIARETGARLVTFGHTHHAEVVTLEGGATYINSGCWLWRGDFTGAPASTWADLFQHPEKFTRTRQLNYVRVDYDAHDQPVGRLLEAGQVMPRDHAERQRRRKGCLFGFLIP